jgi:tetratricopeptide (TPR) repeat protein
MKPQMRLVAMMVAVMAFILTGFAIAAADANPGSTSPQPSAASLLAQAQVEADAGHPTTAKQILVKAAALYPGNMDVQKLLGDVDYRTEDYAGAAAAYKKVLSRDPKNKDVHNRLGGVFAAQDKFGDAISEFRSSLPLSEGFVHLVQTYIDEGRIGDLEAEQQREVVLSPFEAGSHFSLGLVYYYEKKYDLALSEFQAALANDPRSSDSRNGLGMAYGDLGRHTEAIAEYKKVIAQDPKFANAWINWGVELIATSDYRGAIEKISHGLTLKPDLSVGYDNLGVAYDYLDNFTQAVELYERAMQLDPREREAYQNLGSLYFNHNLLNLAEAAFIKGLAVAPRTAGLHFDLGIVYEQQHKYSQALEQYKAALTTDPNNIEMRQQLAGVQAKLVHQ